MGFRTSASDATGTRSRYLTAFERVSFIERWISESLLGGTALKDYHSIEKLCEQSMITECVKGDGSGERKMTDSGCDADCGRLGEAVALRQGRKAFVPRFVLAGCDEYRRTPVCDRSGCFNRSSHVR